MRMKVIALIGLAVVLAATSPAFAGAFFGGGGGHGTGDFSLGNGVVSGVVNGESFSDVGLSSFTFEGTVNCTSNCNSGGFDGEVTPVPQATVSEPLVGILVGLGLVGARFLRRPS